MVIIPKGRPILVYEVLVSENNINLPVYCSGAALATNHKETLHVVFFVDQPTVGGGSERVAFLRVIMHAEGWTPAMDVISRAIKGVADETSRTRDGLDGA